jgi:hypothetical protein
VLKKGFLEMIVVVGFERIVQDLNLSALLQGPDGVGRGFPAGRKIERMREVWEREIGEEEDMSGAGERKKKKKNQRRRVWWGGGREREKSNFCKKSKSKKYYFNEGFARGFPCSVLLAFS